MQPVGQVPEKTLTQRAVAGIAPEQTALVTVRQWMLRDESLGQLVVEIADIHGEGGIRGF